MSIELLAMLGGSLSGFVMKLIAAQSQAQAAQLDGILKKQGIADKSADKAMARTGQAGAMYIVCCYLCTFYSCIL